MPCDELANSKSYSLMNNRELLHVARQLFTALSVATLDEEKLRKQCIDELASLIEEKKLREKARERKERLRCHVVRK